MNVCADVLTLQEVEPHIYTGIRSLLVREKERESERVCLVLSESVGVWQWLYTYEKKWDAVWLYGTLNKAKRVDSLSYIPTHNSRETNAVTFAVIIYINMLQLAVQKRVTTSKRIFKFPEDTIRSFRQSTLDRVYGRNITHKNLGTTQQPEP